MGWLKANWRTVVVIVVAFVLTLCTAGIGAGVAYGAAFSLAASGVSVGTATLLGAAAGYAVAGAIVGAATGALSAALNGGNLGDVLRGAVVGGVSGAITGALHVTGGVVNIAAHGIVGGASNVAMGGKFGDGFLSAAASAATAVTGLTSPETSPLNMAGRTAVASIAGGTASTLGGGKFANGAITGAMSHLLNAEAGTNWSKWSESHFKSKDMRVDSNIYGSDEEGLRSWKIQMHVGQTDEEFILDVKTNEFRNAAGQQLPKEYRKMLINNPSLVKGVSKAIDRVNAAGANIARSAGVFALLAPLGLISIDKANGGLRTALGEYQNHVESRDLSGATFSAASVVEQSGITSDSIKTLLYLKMMEAVE
jgi:hypothetical protein